MSALSPLEFVHREFENPTVQAGLLFFNGLREVDLRVPRLRSSHRGVTGDPAKAQMSRGGTAALARALEAAVRESGGDIRPLTEPKRIVVENGTPSASKRRRARYRVPGIRGVGAQSAADLPRSARRRTSCRATFATARGSSSTTCSLRCSRSISICASRRFTRARETSRA